MDTHTSHLPKPSAVSIFFSGGAYFIHFLSLGFASFPLQTHLRHALTPATASLVASVLPLASCLTYFFFRFAEARSWTRSPQIMLVGLATGVGLMQMGLGFKLQSTETSSWWIGPAVDVAGCLLLLGCVQSSCMTVLNHIGVATMGPHAYTVRAAGSAGYMLAVMLMGALGAQARTISDWHLFIGAGFSVVHVVFALLSLRFVRWSSSSPFPRVAPAPTSSPNPTSSVPSSSNPSSSNPLSSNPLSSNPLSSNMANHRDSARDTERPPSHSSALNVSARQWWGQLILVWMVAMCEMAYGLYSHEFLTSTYGSFGYFVFAGSIALEIVLLLAMPMFPALKQRLLFVGPVGWITLLTGCLLALAGWPMMGFFATALALNCPFQVSANEHAHQMHRSSMVGIASMTLAQSLGYMSATIVSACLSMQSPGPVLLWSCMLPVAMGSLILALWQMAKQRTHADRETLARRNAA
jgi:hypothetical protein